VRRALALLPAVVLAFAVAGCGGGGDGGNGADGSPLSKAEYETKIQTIVKDVGEQFADVDIQENTTEAIDQAVDALEEIADELENVNPPEEIADLHRDLIDGIRGLADELPGFAEKLEATEDPSEAISILFGSESIQKLAQVQEKLKEAGYTIELNETETTP